MRSTVIAALIVASACGTACDDAVLWRAPAPTPKDHSNPFGWPLGPDCVDCKLEAIGTPAWEPARVVLFAGNVGPTGASLGPLAQSILQPLHESDPYAPVFEPIDEHAPDQDEIYELLDARGITPSQAFTDVQFAGPHAVIMALTLVSSAGGVEGEFVSPIQISWELYRDGALFDAGAAFNACPSDTPTKSACAPKSVSHLFATIADNNALAGGPLTPPDGDYEYGVSLSDPKGDGWNLGVPFKVGEGGAPPPPPPAP